MKELIAAIIRATFLLTKFVGYSVDSTFFPCVLSRVPYTYCPAWMPIITITPGYISFIDLYLFLRSYNTKI
jgi:hypothetical protein